MSELLDKYENRGMEKGFKVLIHSFKEIGVSWEMTLQRVKEEFEVSKETAREKMGKYWTE